MSVHAMSWVLRHSEEKLGRRLTLLVLADHAKDDGTGSWPSVDTIASEARLSRRQVQRCLSDLEDAGAIRQTGTKSNGTKVWTLDLTMRGDNMSLGGDIRDPEGVTSTTWNGDRMSPEPSLNRPLEPSDIYAGDDGEQQALAVAHPAETVADVWLRNAPPLTAHRRSTFAEPVVRKAIEKAVARYGLGDLCSAVDAYAQIVADPDYFFDYAGWTIGRFLDRGLDRFVPGADPYRQFRAGRRSAASEDEMVAAIRRGAGAVREAG